MESRSARLSAGRRSAQTDGMSEISERNIITRRRFSKAVNLVKFALRFENPKGTDSEFSHASKPKIQMENTYKMAPDSDLTFKSSKVEDVVRDILKANLYDYVYDQSTSAAKTRNLCSMIKDRVKCLDFKRYKIVANVFLGQNTGQGLEATSRALWHEKTDTYVSVNYTSGTFFVVATVHAVYFE